MNCKREGGKERKNAFKKGIKNIDNIIICLYKNKVNCKISILT